MRTRSPKPTHLPVRGSQRPHSRRTRSLAAGGAIVALLAVSWVIGSQPGADREATTKSAGSTLTANAPDIGAATDEAAPMASTTIASSTGAADAKAYASEADRSRTEDALVASTESGGSTARPVGTSTLDAKIIRTGSAEVVVKKGTFDEAVTRLTSVATGLGGFVSASEMTSLGGDPRGTITIRVPAKEFDRALASLGKIGTVASVTTGSQDVTGEYTDVAAQISALEAERKQILLVLGRADTVPDILAVRDRLSQVQTELEQLQGRQQVLDDQTSLSTLTVSVREKGSAAVVTAPEQERRGLAKLWHDSTDRFLDGARAIALGLATLAPWLLLGLVLWLPARAWWRRYGDATSSPGESTPATATD